MEIILQEYQTEEFDRLWQIDQECFPPGIAYSRLELQTYMRRRGAFTVVARGDRRLPTAAGMNLSAQENFKGIVGFIVAEANRRRQGHIITIDVLPGTRRAGVGSRLLRCAEEKLQAAGCDFVFLETAVDNLSAVAFYKRHLYSVVKIEPRYYSNGVDALVLGKRLADNRSHGKQT